jgi:hypothetical protein
LCLWFAELHYMFLYLALHLRRNDGHKMLTMRTKRLNLRMMLHLLSCCCCRCYCCNTGYSCYCCGQSWALLLDPRYISVVIYLYMITDSSLIKQTKIYKLSTQSSSGLCLNTDTNYKSSFRYTFPVINFREEDIEFIYMSIPYVSLPVSFYNVDYSNNRLDMSINNILYSFYFVSGNLMWQLLSINSKNYWEQNGILHWIIFRTALAFHVQPMIFPCLKLLQ